MLHTIIPRVRLTLPSSIRMALGKAPVQYLSESTSDQRQTNPKRPKTESPNDDITKRSISPIGYIKSCFKSKNGTPRQPSVCTFSRAKLTILKSVFPCPDHSLQGLEDFSHVWIMFLFHKNGQDAFTKAKVKPPRLNGRKVGLFATRSPHRPNPIGLTLAKLDKVDGGTLYLSGVDIIEGTPVLDVKPYVPAYDNPANVLNADTQRSLREEYRTPTTEVANERLLDAKSEEDGTSKRCRPLEQDTTNAGSHSPVLLEDKTIESTADDEFDMCQKSHNPSSSDIIHHFKEDMPDTDTAASQAIADVIHSGNSEHNLDRDLDERTSDVVEVKVADWIMSPPITKLQVEFTTKAERQLSAFKPQANQGTTSLSGSDEDHALEFFKSTQEAKQAIREILEADPRSTYRRTSCSDKLYFFAVDTIHVTCWFYDGIAEVIRVQPITKAEISP